MRRLRVPLFIGLMLLFAAAAFAQTTATLTGTVSTGGSVVPGATVSVTSPALQGSRTTTTGPNGDYNFTGLPPGAYTVKIELAGMQTISKQTTLRLGETSRVDGDLRVSAVSEAITVTAAAPSVLETPQVTTNFDAKLIESLPVGRTIPDRVLLAPGVNNDGPNNQTVINGAQSFDNLYLVNGVVINENVRGQPQAAVIEDAIQETTLITAGVSAEYGRFTGGVVNTITKSGGNEFSGSFRDNLTNDSWTKRTAFRDPVSGAVQAPRAEVLNPVYEATLGGRILRDRLWFFVAGRQQKSDQSFQTVGLNLPYTTVTDQKRYEAKLTGQIGARHTLVGSYLKVKDIQSGTKFGNVVDLESLRSVENPIKLTSFHYNGVLTNSWLLEAQWSKKDFSIVGGGANARDLINGTLLRDIATGRRAWSPTFCGVCEPKQRNNKDWQLKSSYFLSTSNTGSHNIIGGYDEYHELRNENNYQSGSDFRLFGDFIQSGGKVYLHIFPTAANGAINSHFEWDPLLGLSQTSDFATKSIFLNDKWDFNNHWSFNAGARLDNSQGENQAHVKTVDSQRVSPRLAATLDLKGDGKHRISATYGRYVSKIDQGPADSTSTAGRYGTYQFEYRGPEINPIGTPASMLVPTDQVIKAAFDWFKSQGFTDNKALAYSIQIPGLTEKIGGKLKSPYMDEITAGYGIRIGNEGFLRADVIHREWKDFYVTRRDLTTGKTADTAKLDIGLIENSSSGLERKYDALQLQGNYRAAKRLDFGGNYTYSKLKGNVEGEEFNNGTVTQGAIGTSGSNVFQGPQYPEYTGFAQNNPVGYLAEDMRHRAQAWVNFDSPVPYGKLSLSLLERFHSGAGYGAFAIIDDRAFVTNPGYTRPPTAVGYFFGDREGFRLPNITSTNVTLQYSLPVGPVNFFVKGDVLNAFGEQKVEYADTSAGPVIERRVAVTGKGMVAFNPFTQTPSECPIGQALCTGLNFQKNVNFGKATNKDAYQLPRTYRVAVGVRF
jgi:hypothetical protein